MLRDQQDAFGHLLSDCFEGTAVSEIVERDDGYIDIPYAAKLYFSDYQDWQANEREGLVYARGRVLDVGCGAGRVAIHLQKKRHNVVGIDISPLSIAVCIKRGLKKAIALPLEKVTVKLGLFDTIIMYGNNFGLFGSPEKAKKTLNKLARCTSPGARIIADTTNPRGTSNPFHLAYHRRNKAKGRLIGQLRIRVRYKTYKTPWFDYLLAAPEEIEKMLDGTGWKLSRAIGNTKGAYTAIIEKGNR